MTESDKPIRPTGKSISTGKSMSSLEYMKIYEETVKVVVVDHRRRFYERSET
ncbi:hypothetical protein EVB97_136 [Rhizobium phage RHph_Y65]|uniref:Uncharacterized protein n=1 Tax=Rhizobium phage RHph_Y65 TaxID=2509785 RepID=A0A7S5RH06_9CAUD|nr:hypothetical protein PQC17_gp136 [Rhizobium phage RHph_Y65]QIG72694.1 hypothetical protein EVB97_136 [Rhizobium phage RHph_Y65]